jgi:polysaccharide deacetylase 2 family uncharacterized protein YibQ
MLSNAALEKRRIQRRLSNQSNGEKDTVELVTDTMINDAILTSALDRLQSLFSRQYKPAPTQVWAQQRNAKGNRKLLKFPLLPLKKQVGWFNDISQQDLQYQSLSISDELVLFAKYVSVSHVCYCCCNGLVSLSIYLST